MPMFRGDVMVFCYQIKILILVLCLGTCFSCTERSGSKSKKIAVLMNGLVENKFYETLYQGAYNKGIQYGYKVKPVYLPQEDDYEFQINFINQNKYKYDAFVVMPVHSDKYNNIINGIQSLNKPIIFINQITSGQPNSIIKTDDRIGGELAARFIYLKLKNQKLECVTILSGNLKAQDHQDRVKGFKDFIQSKYKNVVFHIYEALSNRSLARKMVLSKLDIIANCPVIFAGSDTMILGASEILESKNLLKNKILIGFDGILEVQKKILEGKVSASVQQETSVLGSTAIDKIKKYFENQKIEKVVIVPPKLITRSYRLDSLSLKDMEMF